MVRKPAELPQNENSVVVPVCKNCGSDDVASVSTVIWNSDKSCWDIAQTITEAECRTCNRTTKLSWSFKDQNAWKTIQILNDNFRRDTGFWETIEISTGVRTKGAHFVSQVLKTVAMFDDFSSVDDPFDLHQCGEIEVQGEKVRFTVVCKDIAGTGLSLNAANQSGTKRTMQVCLLDEL